METGMYGGMELNAENLWISIYEEVTNDEQNYDVKRFTSIAEKIIVTLQTDKADGEHYHLYVNVPSGSKQKLTAKDAKWMENICERALMIATTDYEMPRIEIFVQP